MSVSKLGRIPLTPLVLAALLLWSEQGAAYRPFESTDADVAAAAELEIELGYFSAERSAGTNTFLVPQAVLNYGLTDSLEIVGEFEIAKPEGRSGDVDDVGLFLKSLLREGVLQDSGGLSVAIEGGLLLPAHGGEQTGLEAIGIFSGRAGAFTYHLNVGAGLDRGDHARFALWGGIIEYPLSDMLRLVGELSGERVRGEAKESSALVGFIWESPTTGNAFDGALRRGTSSAAPDWELTLGWTFSLPR